MSVKLTRQDEFAVITLDRQEALNALSAAVLRELEQMFDQVAGGDARGLIVTGAGAKAFCAGADIKELTGRSLSEQRRDAVYGQAVLARLDELPMLSVAAINGYAFGGGMELALACTFRVAAPTAKMGLPEIKLGLIPGYGGTQRLPRVIGEARALDIIMSGRTLDAEEALRIGLVHRIAEGTVLDAAIAYARQFGGYGLPALRLARDAVRRAHDVPLREGLKIEADLNTLAFQTQDAVEGMNAFMEKRKPKFGDR